MSFEDKLPEHIATLEAKILKLRGERLNLLHDCGCERCDYVGDPENAEAAEFMYDVDDQIKEIQAEIEKLEDHAKRKGAAVVAN